MRDTVRDFKAAKIIIIRVLERRSQHTQKKLYYKVNTPDEPMSICTQHLATTGRKERKEKLNKKNKMFAKWMA